jgi:hypothetical protein
MGPEHDTYISYFGIYSNDIAVRKYQDVIKSLRSIENDKSMVQKDTGYRKSQAIVTWTIT